MDFFDCGIRKSLSKAKTLKEEGNKYYKDHELQTSVESYTKVNK